MGKIKKRGNGWGEGVGVEEGKLMVMTVLT